MEIYLYLYVFVVVLNLLAIESGSFPCCIILSVLLTASIRDVGVCIHNEKF